MNVVEDTMSPLEGRDLQSPDILDISRKLYEANSAVDMYQDADKGRVEIVHLVEAFNDLMNILKPYTQLKHLEGYKELAEWAAKIKNQPSQNVLESKKVLASLNQFYNEFQEFLKGYKL